jgi:hypothetical protein
LYLLIFSIGGFNGDDSLGDLTDLGSSNIDDEDDEE